MSAPKVKSTVRPISSATHNDTYLGAFVERCRLAGWTDEQIKRRVEQYLLRK